MRHALILAPLALAVASGLAAAPAPTPGPEGVQSPEDRGFAIVLTNPVDPWVHGRLAIKVETMIPRDDTVDQVDFFVDRHLVFVDTDQPYTTTFDFGPEIRRHTIEVKALTHDGRRARVSFVSRSADLAENAPGRVVTFGAMVRDPAGHPIDRLEVSDFSITEGTAPQSIVHFLAGPSPASIAIVVDPAAAGAHEALARFLKKLPAHQAVALFGPDHPGADAGENDAVAPAAEAALRVPAERSEVGAERAEVGKEKPARATPPPRAEPSPFTYDIPSILAGLAPPAAVPAGPAENVLPAETRTMTHDAAGAARRAGNTKQRAAAPSLPDLMNRAAAAMTGRRGPRLLLVFAAVAPFGEEPLGPPVPAALREGAAEPKRPPAVAAATGKDAGRTPPGNKAQAPEEEDPLTAAIDAARRSGAALHVIALPTRPEFGWNEAQLAERAMARAAEASGGVLESPADGAAVDRALDALLETLRHQYIVSYVSSSAANAGWKPLEVEVRGRERAIQAPRAIFLGEAAPVPSDKAPKPAAGESKPAAAGAPPRKD